MIRSVHGDPEILYPGDVPDCGFAQDTNCMPRDLQRVVHAPGPEASAAQAGHRSNAEYQNEASEGGGRRVKWDDWEEPGDWDGHNFRPDGIYVESPAVPGPRRDDPRGVLHSMAQTLFTVHGSVNVTIQYPGEDVNASGARPQYLLGAIAEHGNGASARFPRNLRDIGSGRQSANAPRSTATNAYDAHLPAWREASAAGPSAANAFFRDIVARRMRGIQESVMEGILGQFAVRIPTAPESERKALLETILDQKSGVAAMRRAWARIGIHQFPKNERGEVMDRLRALGIVTSNANVRMCDDLFDEVEAEKDRNPQDWFDRHTASGN